MYSRIMESFSLSFSAAPEQNLAFTLCGYALHLFQSHIPLLEFHFLSNFSSEQFAATVDVILDNLVELFSAVIAQTIPYIPEQVEAPHLLIVHEQFRRVKLHVLVSQVAQQNHLRLVRHHLENLA